jgi:hypothetical protein
MMKITLRDQEHQQLEAIFKTTPDRRLRARCQAILMASQGQRSTLCFNPNQCGGKRWTYGSS